MVSNGFIGYGKMRSKWNCRCMVQQGNDPNASIELQGVSNPAIHLENPTGNPIMPTSICHLYFLDPAKFELKRYAPVEVLQWHRLKTRRALKGFFVCHVSVALGPSPQKPSVKQMLNDFDESERFVTWNDMCDAVMHDSICIVYFREIPNRTHQMDPPTLSIAWLKQIHI